MSNVPLEVSSEMHLSSDEDLASVSSIKKDKDWIQSFLDASVPPYTSNGSSEEEECSGANPELRLPQLSTICRDVVEDLGPAAKDTSRLELENKALKRSLERVKCDKELQIANLTFQLNLKSKQLEEQSNELRNVQRMLEDKQRNLIQFKQQLNCAVNENSSLKESRQEAFELAKKLREEASTLTNDKDILRLELNNEKKLRQAVESEQRLLSSNVLTRLSLAREASVVAETEKDRLQEELRKLRFQLNQLTQQHSQKTSNLQNEIECLKVQVKENQKTIELKDTKLKDFGTQAKQLLETRFKRIEKTLFIFEEHLGNRISLVKESYNSNQNNTFQRLDTIQHELKSEISTSIKDCRNSLECVQGLRPIKISHFLEQPPNEQDLSKEAVKLKKAIRSYAQAFQKQREYCRLYDFIVKELVHESKAFEAEFEVQCKSNKALKQKLQEAQIQIATLTQKLKTNEALSTPSRSNVDQSQGHNSSSNKDIFDSKMKTQRAAIRKYKIQISSLLAQKEVLLQQTPTTRGTKTDIKDLVIRRIDPRILEASFT